MCRFDEFAKILDVKRTKGLHLELTMRLDATYDMFDNVVRYHCVEPFSRGIC